MGHLTYFLCFVTFYKLSLLMFHDQSLEVVQAGRCMFTMLGFHFGTSASQGMQNFRTLAQQQEDCLLPQDAALLFFYLTHISTPI